MAALASAVIVSAPQAKPYTLSNAESVATNTELGLSQQNTQAAVRAEGNETKQSTDPNYSEDEKKIKDYNGSERYRQTDLQPGDTNQEFYNTDEKEEKDGFKFQLNNPSSTSPSKTKYGYQITIDKKTGQRTYTRIYVTDSGLVPAELGEKTMMDQGDKLTPESPDVTFTPDEKGEITAGGRQRNLHYEASEDTLKHINNMDNPLTSFGMKDNYTKDNPGVKFFGGSFTLNYKVNPWPNENDKLEELKLNKNNYDPNKKYFVQGQDIDTGIKVDNVDENAKERLVGQVYNPITGKIVPGASAYIGKNGNIHVKLPEGALKKDENGKTVINENSIFNTADYKALQNLDVKFFARPRTKGEFTNIAETPDKYGETGTYVETGAGSADINHKGTNVTIDKQGIDRYDHYNLIGDFKLNLDDTRYYDQRFEDGNGDDTSKVTSSAVKPGEPFKVGIVQPENPSDTDKSAADMNGAQDRGEASGRLIMDFINRENKGKAPEDQWKVDVNPKDISNFTITAPKSAKAGDFVAIPVEYTYTNGSKDTHWFHFVVQESTNNVPEYYVQVEYPSEEQKSTPKLPENPDDKKLTPQSYSIPEGTEFKDNKGNEWTVSIDNTTGEVTAKPNDPSKFDGGETLTVPVVAHYEDPNEPDKDITEETKAEFVIKEKANMTPRYNAKAGKAGDELSSEVILNEEDTYNRRPTKFTLDSDTFTDDKGNTWNVKIDENTGKVTATVPNGEGDKIDGALLNVPVKAHYYETDGTEIATKEVEVQFVASGTDGTKTYTEKIPFGYKVEYDPNFYTKYPEATDGYKIVTEGQAGEKKTTLTIKDSQIVDTQDEVTKQPVDALIKVGKKDFTGTFVTKKTKTLEFETKYVVDNSLEPGTTKVEQEGELGEEVTTVTHTIVNGKVTKSEDGETTRKEPKDRIVKVGPAKTDGTHEYTNKIPYEVEIRVNPELKKDERKIIQKGEVGEEKYTIKIENSKVVETSDPVVTKEAKKEIIEVGTEDYTGEFEYVDKEVIPFDTEVKINPNLEPNQIKEITPGENGSKERKITQKYTNGEKGDLVVGEYKTTKEPVTRVIEVGPGKTDGTHTYTNKIPFDVEVRVNPELKKGESKVVQKGEVGEEEYTITIENSKVTKTSDPVVKKEAKKEIIEVGSQEFEGEVKHTEELPFKYKVEEVEDLKKGEYRIVKPGKVGTKTTTWTIKDSQVVGEPKEEIVEAEDALIQVGKGTNDGTHDIVEKKELPFETRYEYDDSLEPGEEKVVQEGKPGLQERTNTLVIKDGKVTEVKEGEFKTITEPEERIVKIGRKPTEGEVTKTIEREIPYETKVIYDENLEAGFQKIENEGKPGKEEVTITQKIKDSKPAGDPTETTKTITEKEDRVVRIGVKPVVKETELGHDTEYRHNPNLKEGETKVIEEGSNGSIKYTTTFNKETGKLEVKEERTEPKNKVVEYGSKTDGEFTYESEKAYDIIIRENPNLEAGKTKVIQEGIVGKTETTVKIENSKEVDRTTKTITEKQDKIIEIGTKNVCEIPPVKPEDPTDPEQPGGEDPKDPEKPGKPGDKDPEKPGKPGDKDPEKPDKPGDKDPEKPGKPDEDPKDPEQPGGEDPKNPEQPGKEDPKDPEQPGGEDPKDPDQPGGKDPKDPGTPGGKDPKDPGTPGGKDPKDPETPGKTPENNGKTPENNGKTPENNGKTPGATGQVDGKSTTTNNKTPKRLPKSGSESEIMTLAMSGLLAAAGFIGLKKKRKDQ